MGENECLDWFPRYIPSKPMCNDVGCIPNVPTIEYVGLDTSGKPIYKPKTYCGIISKLSPNDAERFAKVKTEMDAMAEKYKPIADKLVEEIYESSQKPIELLSEETAQQINEVFKDFGKAVSSVFPLPSTKSTKRKHYKPKFTL